MLLTYRIQWSKRWYIHLCSQLLLVWVSALLSAGNHPPPSHQVLFLLCLLYLVRHSSVLFLCIAFDILFLLGTYYLYQLNLFCTKYPHNNRDHFYCRLSTSLNLDLEILVLKNLFYLFFFDTGIIRHSHVNKVGIFLFLSLSARSCLLASISWSVWML